MNARFIETTNEHDILATVQLFDGALLAKWKQVEVRNDVMLTEEAGRCIG